MSNIFTVSAHIFIMFSQIFTDGPIFSCTKLRIGASKATNNGKDRFSGICFSRISPNADRKRLKTKNRRTFFDMPLFEEFEKMAQVSFQFNPRRRFPGVFVLNLQKGV